MALRRMNLGNFLAGMAECAERDRREFVDAYRHMTDRESVRVRERAEREADEYAYFRQMLGQSSLLETLEKARKSGTIVEVIVGSDNWKEMLQKAAADGPKAKRRASKPKPASGLKLPDDF